jgi:hypothetical protein
LHGQFFLQQFKVLLGGWLGNLLVSAEELVLHELQARKHTLGDHRSLDLVKQQIELSIHAFGWLEVLVLLLVLRPLLESDLMLRLLLHTED